MATLTSSSPSLADSTSLRLLKTRPHGVTISDVAKITGFSRAAVRRLLMTLCELGYAQCHIRSYTLTARALRLGFSFLSSSTLATTAQPILERITETVHESSSLAILDDTEVLYVARAAGMRVMRFNVGPGSRLAAYCSSMGRVLLSDKPDKEVAALLARSPIQPHTVHTLTHKTKLLQAIRLVRSQGYSIVDEEIELGVRSVAVPVRSRRGQLVASMNISVNAYRVPLHEMVTRLLPLLQESALTLGNLLE